MFLFFLKEAGCARRAGGGIEWGVIECGVIELLSGEAGEGFAAVKFLHGGGGEDLNRQGAKGAKGLELSFQDRKTGRGINSSRLGVLGALAVRVLVLRAGASYHRS
jgi:hypothetical protein